MRKNKKINKKKPGKFVLTEKFQNIKNKINFACELKVMKGSLYANLLIITICVHLSYLCQKLPYFFINSIRSCMGTLNSQMGLYF